MPQPATNPTIRHISRRVRGVPATDGAGVELIRVIGSPELEMLDPFLLLDVFHSDQPQDYIAGFPPHPHRGFETVTYLLAGRMRHRDSAGHEGVIEAGGVQWMTAGRGIVHSEMPEQHDGLLAGFQLWVNLPANEKMCAPAYQEYAADQIPVETRPDGATLRVIAGTTQAGTRGPVCQPLTDPRYFDIQLPPGARYEETLPGDHNAFLFVIAGALTALASNDASKTVTANELAILSHGERVTVDAGNTGARVLLVSGRALQEPVVRGGPFVMNTKAQLRQAMEDYANGRF